MRQTILKTHIKNTHYYDEAQAKFVSGDVLVEDGVFTMMGKASDVEGAKVIEGSSYLLLPSFQNAHTHVAMGLLRGYGSDTNLKTWLNDYIWPAEGRLSDEDVYWGTSLGLLEMLASGTTAFMEMYDHTEAIMEATSASGMRINICRGSVGMFDDSHKGISENIAFYQKWHGKDDRVRVYFGPHAPNTCPPDYIQEMVKQAKAYHTGIHIHLAETKEEVAFIQETYQKTPTQYLNDLGVFDLDVPTGVAHGVYLTDEDREILVSKGAILLHNPISNMKLASGWADIIAYQKKGGIVALGTDGASSNNNLDMLKEMQMGALVHKMMHLDPESMKASEMLALATSHGAKALGFENTGKIALGYQADFILLSREKPHHYPHHDDLANLLYSAKSTDIDYVFVGGKCLYQKGEYLTLDKEKILYEAKRVAKKIVCS